MTELNTNKNIGKRFCIFDVELAYLTLLGIATAFIGWFVENISMLLTYGVIDARNHTLPFISVYGLIPFALHLALGNADDITVFGKKIFTEKSRKNKALSNLLCFLVMCMIVFLGEFMVLHGFEILFGIELWDFRVMPLAITQYTSVITTFGFGFGTYVIFKFIYTPVLNFVRKHIKYSTAKYIAIFIGGAILVDMFVFIFFTILVGKPPMLWSISFR